MPPPCAHSVPWLTSRVGGSFLGHVHAFMKTIFAYVLTCLSVVAAGTNDVQVVTTTDTNAQPGVLITVDTYTRGGQTNLIRVARTRAGEFVDRQQTFYHDGSRLGGLLTYPHGSSFLSTVGAPCFLTVNSIDCDGSNNLFSAFVINSNSVLADAFTCTNGIFYPEDSAYIQRMASHSHGLPH